MSVNPVEAETCPLCGEAIVPSDDTEWMGGRVHVECALRTVIGGIGHITDHSFWCVQEGDPDGGHAYRASAKYVRRWVERNGIEAAWATTGGWDPK